jgi:hypothetical protein
MAPSWNWLEFALINSFGSFVRCLQYFAEIAQFGFKERLQNAPRGGLCGGHEQHSLTPQERTGGDASTPASFGPSPALRLLPSRALSSVTADRIFKTASFGVKAKNPGG